VKRIFNAGWTESPLRPLKRRERMKISTWGMWTS